MKLKLTQQIKKKKKKKGKCQKWKFKNNRFVKNANRVRDTNMHKLQQ